MDSDKQPPFTPNPSVRHVGIDVDVATMKSSPALDVKTPRPPNPLVLQSASRRPSTSASSPDSSDDVLSLAAEVTDCNIILASHVETLRARVMELEDENDVLRQRERAGLGAGTEALVDRLQADIADVQRECALLKVAKRNADAELAGMREQNAMLQAILERERGGGG
jgi:hypothetical protein